MRIHQLTRTALLLALTLLFQSLRSLIPLPPASTIFLIGSLVNACLLITVRTTGLPAAMLVSIIAPIVAYMQQLLPIPVFILPVAAANTILVIIYHWLRPKSSWLSLLMAAAGKSAVLYVSFSWLLTHLLHLQPKVTAAMLFTMSWPQLITAIIGGIMANLITNRINQIKKI